MLFVVFGVKVFARVQKVIMVVAIARYLVILLVFTFTSHEAFVQAWNNLAAQYGSLDYEGFLASARTAIADSGKTLPTTWNWFDTFGVMVAGSWLFAYAYCITFIAGEVKRPDKTIILANLSAVLVPAAFMIWLAAALYNTVGFEFLSATAWVDNMGVEALAGYTLPWSPHFVGLAAVINQNPFVVFMMGLSYILFTLWWVALSYLAFPRILFAWGMDRMGPKWFADIDFRWASPVKNHHPVFHPGGDRDCDLCLGPGSDGRAFGDRHGDRFRLWCHCHCGGRLPVLEEGQGHLGVLALQEVEDPGDPGGHHWCGRST